MAHFCELDDNNKVLQVIVVANSEILDESGVEQESKGIEFCQNLFGGTWVQTSLHGNFRKNYAGVDYTYSKDLDAFIPPKPFESWSLNTDSCKWESPIPYPNNGEIYYWDEQKLKWLHLIIEDMPQP